MPRDVSVVRGGEDLGDESLYAEASRLPLAAPAPRIAHKEKWEARQERKGGKVLQERRQRRQKKEHRRRNGAHLGSCHLAQLPSELLLQVMHHMDKGSLKSFVLTSKRMHNVREANATAVFKGMQREQYPGYLSAFGDPTKRSSEQVEEMRIAAEMSAWWGNAPRLGHNNPRSLWWQHFTDLAILEENLDAETAALRNLGGDAQFDAALSRDAILLQWRLSLRMGGTPEEDGQQQVQMFLNHPAEIQRQLLQAGRFLGAAIEKHVELTVIAGCWAALDHHLPEAGSPKETRFVDWISARVTAYTLAVVFRGGSRGVAALLQCAKDSTAVSEMRYEFVELLVNDAEVGEGGFEMGMTMSQTIGFHALTFADTKQSVARLLGFWRHQPAESRVAHLKRFVGI